MTAVMLFIRQLNFVAYALRSLQCAVANSSPRPPIPQFPKAIMAIGGAVTLGAAIIERGSAVPSVSEPPHHENDR